MEIFIFAIAVVAAYGWLGGVVINYYEDLRDELEEQRFRIERLERKMYERDG